EQQSGAADAPSPLRTPADVTERRKMRGREVERGVERRTRRERRVEKSAEEVRDGNKHTLGVGEKEEGEEEGKK
ncbi:hypothetical protein CCH79_00008080, partial [Gambusia affinis]